MIYIKSWYDLTNEEQKNMINEFREKYSGPNTKKLHEINKWLLVLIIPLAIFVIVRIIVQTDETIGIAKFILLILIIIYIFNLVKIAKENSAFKKWLKTKNILK